MTSPWRFAGESGGAASPSHSVTLLPRVPPSSRTADSTVLVVRRRYAGDGLREDVTIRNTDLRTPQVRLSVEPDGFRIASERSRPERSISVVSDDHPSHEPGTVRWPARLAGHAEWHATIEAIPALEGVPLELRHPRNSGGL